MDPATFLAEDRQLFVAQLQQLGVEVSVAHFQVDTGAAQILVTCVDRSPKAGLHGSRQQDEPSPRGRSGQPDVSGKLEALGTPDVPGCVHENGQPGEIDAAGGSGLALLPGTVDGVSGGSGEFVGWLAGRASPWVLIPGWVSSLGNWSDVVSVIVQVSPVVIVFTREKPGSVVAAGAGQTVAEVTGDVATVWDLMPQEPRAVWGVSTGSAVVCDLVADKKISVDMPTVLALPHLKIPVPKIATYVSRLPSRCQGVIRGVAARELQRREHEFRTRDLLRAVMVMGPDVIAESAGQWRQWRPSWREMTQSIVLGVGGDRMHSLRDAHAVAVAVGGHLLNFATYCDGQNVAAAQDVVSYWNYGVSIDG